jgi:hypothetical protein
MAKELLNGRVGNIELNAQRKINEEIRTRWQELGFVKGLDGHLKDTVSVLYENQAKHLMTEATASDNSGSFETVVFPIIRRVFSKLLANDIVSVQAMNLPIGKLFFLLPVTSERNWDYQVAGQITDGDMGSHYGLMGYERSDRNMRHTANADGTPNFTDPSGRAINQPYQHNRFYLPDNTVTNAVIDEAIDGTTLATVLTGATGTDPDMVGRNISTKLFNNPEVVQFYKKSLYDLFYDDFLYDNSKGKIRIRVGNSTPVVLMPDGSWGDVASALNTYPQNGLDNSIRNIILRVRGFNSYNAGRLIGPDGNEMDTEAFSSSLKVMTMTEICSSDDFTCFEQFESIPYRVVTQRYGKGMVEYNGVCDALGSMYIELDLTKPVKKQGQTMDGYVGVDPAALTATTADAQFKIAWAQYDSLELETEIGEVSFKLDSVTVSVEERKLRATWSPELAQDVAAFHNIDAEAELTAILSEQIAAEIDREILRDLRKDAPWQRRWDVHGWRRQAAFSTNYTQKDWNQELITNVNQVSAQIHKSTLRGGANFIVVSSEISALFDNLEYFHVSDASAESDQYNMGIERVGSLSGRYQVYRDPYSPHYSMIIGHKGKSLLDTGYIYAPYVPMQLTPTMYNPFNFAPVKGIITRYAKKLVNNRFYGHVRVDGLVHWDTRELQ